MAASTASACLRRLSPFVYSHNSSQASARSGMSEFCSTKRVKPQKAQKARKRIFCGLFRADVLLELINQVLCLRGKFAGGCEAQIFFIFDQGVVRQAGAN